MVVHHFAGCIKHFCRRARGNNNSISRKNGKSEAGIKNWIQKLYSTYRGEDGVF